MSDNGARSQEPLTLSRPRPAPGKGRAGHAQSVLQYCLGPQTPPRALGGRQFGKMSAGVHQAQPRASLATIVRCGASPRTKAAT